MPRRKKPVVVVEHLKKTTAATLHAHNLANQIRRKKGSLSTAPKKTPKARGVSATLAARYMSELEEHLTAETIDELSPRHWVALYCWIFEAVYSVACVNEVRVEWNIASAQAARMFKEEFEEDHAEFYAYLRWIGYDEERAERWRRRDNGGAGGRLQWRHVFLTKSKLTSYRIAMARKEGNG